MKWNGRSIASSGGASSTYKVVVQSTYYDNTTGAPIKYLPFNSLSEMTSPTPYLSVIPAVSSGKVVKAAVWFQGAAGSTVMGVHINGSTTATVSDTQTASAGAVSTFTFGTHSFNAGDELGFSIDPTNLPYGVSAQILIEYDE
jgi:hypothetical protein